LLTLARGLPALTRWQNEKRNEAETLLGDLVAARSGVRQLPALRDSLRARQARLAAIDSAIFIGQTASAAAASLASTVEDLADEASVKVSAMQLHADSASSGALVEVGVRLTGVADVYGLLALLRDIEGGTILLAVRDLAVTQPEPAAPANKPETLRVDMMVVGLARVENAAESKGAIREPQRQNSAKQVSK
jgi:hypothetical protein